MADVAERYGALFAETLEKGGTSHAPAALKTIRDVLFGPDAPVYPPLGSLTDTHFYFDEAARVNLGKLFKEIEVWHLTAEGATPHAGILEDRAQPRTPRVFQRGNPGKVKMALLHPLKVLNHLNMEILSSVF
jgi:hypothetical protein